MGNHTTNTTAKIISIPICISVVTIICIHPCHVTTTLPTKVARNICSCPHAVTIPSSHIIYSKSYCVSLCRTVTSRNCYHSTARNGRCLFNTGRCNRSYSRSRNCWNGSTRSKIIGIYVSCSRETGNNAPLHQQFL